MKSGGDCPAPPRSFRRWKAFPYIYYIVQTRTSLNFSGSRGLMPRFLIFSPLWSNPNLPYLGFWARDPGNHYQPGKKPVFQARAELRPAFSLMNGARPGTLRFLRAGTEPSRARPSPAELQKGFFAGRRSSSELETVKNLCKSFVFLVFAFFS